MNNRVRQTEVVEYLTNNQQIYLRIVDNLHSEHRYCLLYTSPSPRDRTRSRMPSSA